ncbi:DUF6059 family protein [Streptomyces sp. NPDC001599]|uniref:DUF6059 family protein n=1 Tax=Streptomyces sp. NPDC001599 TaxID=3364591 RepID=UPI0036B47C86
MRGAARRRHRVIVLLHELRRMLIAYGGMWTAPGCPEYTALILRSGDPPPGHPESRDAGTPLSAEERDLERRMYADDRPARERPGGRRKRNRPGHGHRPRGNP